MNAVVTAIPLRDEPASAAESEQLSLPEGTVLFAGALIVTIAALSLFGGSVGRFAIPAITTAAAYFLYRKSPVLYVSLVWWLFFLICLVRRVIDYRSGYSEQSVILAAPYLAALVCLPTMLDRANIWRLRTSLPFTLALVSSLYGFCVGILYLHNSAVAVGALEWFSPVIFGFFLYTEMITTDRRQAHIAGLRSTFCWGTLLMGVYGIYQFIVAPKWDAQWMIDSGMNSIGSPEPYLMRVFGTMNGPGTLASSIAAGLMFALFTQDKVTLLSRGAGFVTLLLTSVRAAWGSLAIALLLLAFREKKYIGKLIGAGVILLLCAGAAMTIEPVRERIEDRFLSFGDMKGDTSYQERTGGYREMFNYVLDAPLGYGLGTMDTLFEGKTSLGARDSGILETVLSLGWVGGAVFFLSLFLLASNQFSNKVMRSPSELLAACISIGLLCQLPMGGVIGVTGFAIWTFGAIAMAPLASAEMSR